MRLLGCWVLLAVVSLPLTAQRLSEFLQVRGWQGTITVSGGSIGSHDGAFGSDKWSATYASTVNLRLDKFSQFGQFWSGTVTGNASMDLTNVYTGSGCTKTTTIKAQGAPKVLVGDGFMLTVDRGDTYSLTMLASNVDGPITETMICPGQSAGSLSNTNPYEWFPTGEVDRYLPFPLPATGLVLSGSTTVPMQLPLLRLSYGFTELPPPARLTVTWNLQPLGVDEVELVVDPAEYKQWRPEAGAGGAIGNNMIVQADLKTKNGSPLQVSATRLTWELVTSSKEPGWAMNVPLTNPSQKFDMRFEEGGGLLVMDQEGQRAETPITTSPLGLRGGIAKIGSYDWGGFATLKVTAELTDGRKIVGHLKDDDAVTEIPVPKRFRGSNIAETWMIAKSMTGNSDGDDDESQPEGDSNRGDGLTLYEEYRGFQVDGKHVEGDPKKKDLFIRNKAGGVLVPGIKMFAGMTGLNVLYQLTDSEVGTDRVINKNYSSAPHKVDQHAIVVVLDPTISGYAEAYNPAGRPGPPKDIEYVHLPARGLMGSSLGTARFVNYMNLSLAHELLHSCNVYHHGDIDDRAVVWTRGVGSDVVLEDGLLEVQIKTEAGASMNLTVPAGANHGMLASLGAKNGLQSGVEECVMRYDAATGYVSTTDPLLRYTTKETPGTTLCDSVAGTGVNDSGRTPQSRFGDAASGRGRCKLQILVNDAVGAPRR